MGRGFVQKLFLHRRSGVKPWGCVAVGVDVGVGLFVAGSPVPTVYRRGWYITRALT